MRGGSRLSEKVTARLSSKLSPQGRRVWNEMERLAEPPKGEWGPDHRDKLISVAARSGELPASDQPILDALLAAKKRVLLRRSESLRKESDELRWLIRRMQEEGLARGLNREERRNMTIGDLIRGRRETEEGPST
jgi:hypothetical protein